MFCFHNYTKWSCLKLAERVIAAEFGKPTTLILTVQEKRCNKCNKVVRRIVDDSQLTSITED